MIEWVVIVWWVVGWGVVVWGGYCVGEVLYSIGDEVGWD